MLFVTALRVDEVVDLYFGGRVVDELLLNIGQILEAAVRERVRDANLLETGDKGAMATHLRLVHGDLVPVFFL